MDTTFLTIHRFPTDQVSHVETIFAGLEAERKFANEGDTGYTSFFDLDSAFDTSSRIL